MANKQPTIEITAPASKSYLQRALAIALLTKGKTVLNNVSWCDDSLVVKNLIKELGANITENNQQLIIHANGFQVNSSSFSMGESGLALRMFSPIFSLIGKFVTLTGSGTLKKRPIDFIAKSLQSLGVETISHNGLLPLKLKGKIMPGKITIDGSISSQLLTGLLIALPIANGDSEIIVKNLKSMPYIDMTLSIINHFGVNIKHDDYQHFFISGNQQYLPNEYTIEGDWSGAAYLLIAAALTGKVKIKNLSENSVQADRKILDVLKMVGAKVSVAPHTVIVEKQPLKVFRFDATHCPDLFPPLVALAANCDGISEIIGVSRLTHKESNRAKVLKEELSKVGINIIIENDVMRVSGGKVTGGVINSHHDHRIAMMAAVLNLVSVGKIEILHKETVNKSYPGFFADMNKLKKS